MKKHIKQIKNKIQHRAALTLGDLILAVSSESQNSSEAAVALADLFRRKRVTFA